MRKKVLIISYLFPPAGGVAVQRALSLAKYLPACGFEVHVLRASNGAAPVHDPGLLKHVPAGVQIHHAATLEPSFKLRQRVWSWFSRSKKGMEKNASGARPGGWKARVTRMVRRILCPEPEVLWVPLGLRKARRIVREHGIDAVLVTAPPFSAFLIGDALKREFPEIHLISDFRDSWLDFYHKAFDYQNSEYTRRRSAEIERATVESSDFVVSVTPSICDELRQRYSEQPADKFIHIPNGYDPEVFKRSAPRARAGGKIVVTHLGTVYAASSPRYFLDVLESMPEPVRSAFELRFLGRIANEEQATVAGRNGIVKLLGFMPQSEALRRFAEADYALLVMTDAASLTGKLFEYLGTGKPILAIAPRDGEVANTLRETGGGWCADPRDPAAIADMIQQAYLRVSSGHTEFAPNWAAIERYERPRLVAEFGRLLAKQNIEAAKVEAAKVEVI